MSIIVASREQICKSALNRSPSKQMYSFGKTERFPPVKSSGYSYSFYNLPDMRMKRFTTLGKGNKYDFTSGHKGNNAQLSNYKSDFDRAHPNAPSYSFGVGRDKYEKVYVESAKIIDINIPGPGKYSILKPFGANSVKFSIKGKHRSRSVDVSFNMPGPGSYQNSIQINPGGKYPISKIANIAGVNFGADKRKRDLNKSDIGPGPLDYPQKPLFGEIFNSKYKSNQGKSIAIKFKEADSRYNYPGPGKYKAFSEFGIY